MKQFLLVKIIVKVFTGPPWMIKVCASFSLYYKKMKEGNNLSLIQFSLQEVKVRIRFN